MEERILWYSAVPRDSNARPFLFTFLTPSLRAFKPSSLRALKPSSLFSTAARFTRHRPITTKHKIFVFLSFFRTTAAAAATLRRHFNPEALVSFPKKEKKKKKRKKPASHFFNLCRRKWWLLPQFYGFFAALWRPEEFWGIHLFVALFIIQIFGLVLMS